MESSARTYFEQLIAGGYAGISALPGAAEPTFENDWRDFKGWYAGPDKEKELRSVWSKAVAAFANTEGGVVLWGVVAEMRSGSKVDRVTGLAEVGDPDAWIQKLKNWKLDLTDPPVGNIEYASIPNPAAPTGFVACLIPESKLKPHRAEFANQNYYVRAGDSSVVPRPSLLRLMFFPQPIREAKLDLEIQGDTINFNAHRIVFGLVNSGYYSIRNIAVRFEVHETDDTRGRRNWHVYQMTHAADTASPGIRHDKMCLLPIDLHPGAGTKFAYLETNLREPITFTITVLQADAAPLQISVTVDFLRTRSGQIKLRPIDPESGVSASE